MYIAELTEECLNVGENTALQRSNTQEQLEYIRGFSRKACDAMRSLSACLLPKKPAPANAEGLLKRLLKAPQYFLDWKESSARSGAAHVLALAKTYYPSFDAARVAQGRPSKKVDGTDLTASEYTSTWKSMRGHATELVDGVDLATYLGKYNADGSRFERLPTPSTSADIPQEKNPSPGVSSSEAPKSVTEKPSSEPATAPSGKFGKPPVPPSHKPKAAHK